MKSFKTPKGTELPLLDMRGKDYLQVAHRLVWFREEKPAWSIETSFEVLTEKDSLAKAVIRDEAGRVISTAHKYEDKAGFSDFREKAETGAIGRALALVGYGTQFCANDLDEGDRIADAPVQRVPNAFGPPDPSYRIPFGSKFKGMTVEEAYHAPNGGPEALRGWISFLEESSRNEGKPLHATAARAVDEISKYLAKMELASSDLR
jgi:hypothetical protein